VNKKEIKNFLMKEGLLGTIAGSGAGALLGYLKSQGKVPKGFEDFENPAKAAELDAIMKGKSYITIDPATGNKETVPAEISKLLSKDIQTQYDNYLGVKKTQNIKAAGSGAALGGVGGAILTKKKKKKKNESKISRAQLVELAQKKYLVTESEQERQQLQEIWPWLATAGAAGLARLGPTAVKYGPKLWKTIKNLGKYELGNYGGGAIAGQAGIGTGGAIDSQLVDKAFGSDDTTQRNLSTALTTEPTDATYVKQPTKIDTIDFTKDFDFVKGQSAADRLDSLKNVYKIGK